MKIKPIKKIFAKQIVIIRTANPADCNAVLDYFRQLYLEAHEFLNYPPEFYQLQTAKMQQDLIRTINADSRSLLLFANYQDSIIGHVLMQNFSYPVAKHSASLMLGVLEAWRSNGIGKVLLQYALQQAKAANISHVETRIRAHNQAALKLCESNAFVLAGKSVAAAQVNNRLVDEMIYYLNH